MNSQTWKILIYGACCFTIGFAAHFPSVKTWMLSLAMLAMGIAARRLGGD